MAESDRAIGQAILEGIRQLKRGEHGRIRDENGERASFVLRDGSVDGYGLQTKFCDETWSSLREAAYEARGSCRTHPAFTTRRPR